MNRLTWDGIALHAGNLPGYPASQGCVRLPLAFSEKLWTVTHLGTPVIVAGAHIDPWELTHPGMVLGAYAEEEFEAAVASLEDKRHPSDWEQAQDYPVTTVVASTLDGKIDLIENGRVVVGPKQRPNTQSLVRQLGSSLPAYSQRARDARAVGVRHPAPQRHLRRDQPAPRRRASSTRQSAASSMRFSSGQSAASHGRTGSGRSPIQATQGCPRRTTNTHDSGSCSCPNQPKVPIRPIPSAKT
jgi:hypothetical protein